MDYVDRGIRQNTIATNPLTAHLGQTRNSLTASHVYNFNGRSMLVDGPIHGTYPFEILNNPRYYNTMMDSIQIQPPYNPGRKTVSSNTPSEYHDRFYSRPTGRPNVVGFDGHSLATRSGRHDTRGFNGFFPSAKLRVATPTNTSDTVQNRSKHGKSDGSLSPKTPKTPKTPKSNRPKQPGPQPFILELVPEKHPASPSSMTSSRTCLARVTSGRSTKTIQSNRSSKCSKASSKSVFDSHPPVYPYMIENPQKSLDDLAGLPKPMMVVSRDNPWVFRYKVKRSMNELSKILASKPLPVAPIHTGFPHQ